MPVRVRVALLLAILACAASQGEAVPTPEERAIEEIRAEALATAAGREGWRLPLAASWNDGASSTGFGPAWQVGEIERGRYLLPWFGLSIPPPPAGAGTQTTFPEATDTLYYSQAAIRYLAEHHLPLSFESTQWERLLSEVSPDYARQEHAGQLAPLSPFDPLEPWYAVGLGWARHPTLQRLQQIYPDPPLVLFISNNEQSKMTPDELSAGFSASADAALTSRRRAIGDAWIARYREMQRGFREGLTAPGWRAHAVFVGYDAFAGPALGRWNGWPAYSLYVTGRTEPWPYAWDGASVSYYLHNWAGDADYIVCSPQIEAMNYVPVLEEVRRVEPDFWFEMSVWDGQLPGQPSDKLRFYAEHQQQFTPARYGGMVQFGMWLLRPRVVREFRNRGDDRIRFGKYFDAIVAAVGRVHDDPALRDFWRAGRLLPNPSASHPYEVALPPELAARARWFLLDSPLNPARPWELTTPLPVYSIALEQGRKPRRQWLVYAFSPRHEALQADVSIPGGPQLRVDASVDGTFTLVSEADGTTRAVGLPRITR